MSASNARKGGDAAERVSIRISPRVRTMIEEIKDMQDFDTDADVLRHALAAYHRISEAEKEKDKIVLYDKDKNLKGELIFIKSL